MMLLLLPAGPMRKLSGLISRYMSDFSWIAWTRVIYTDGVEPANRLAVRIYTNEKICRDRRWSTNHLLCAHSNRFDAKLSITHVEEIFEIGAEKVNHEDVV